MRILLILLRKEFRQILRNKAVLGIVFIAPMVQFLILPLAANLEIKQINLAVVDNDHSPYSQQMISKITGSGYFKLVANSFSFKNAYSYVENDKADLVLEIPEGFERNLLKEGSQKVFIAVNAINGMKANLGGAYLNSIIIDFNKDILARLISEQDIKGSGLEITSSNWFNPELSQNLGLIPGLLSVLVTLVGGFLAALNIVKEKEIGTIEQINVTPVKKRNFILSKLIPFWILANIVFTNGLILGYFIYDIVPQGSIPLLYLFVSVYLLAVLGLGLLVSTYCDTQQQAMFIMFFFMMIFMLMGGLFTPVNSMPNWAKYMAQLNPVKHLIEVIRLIMVKGSSLKNVFPQFIIIATMALVLNTWAVLNYKKTN